MIIIGERINATRKPIARALRQRDAGLILKEARAQVAAGAHYLDLNAGLGKGTEREDMTWLIETVQQLGPQALCLDSSDPAVLDACLPLVKNPDVMINSINGEEKRIAGLLPVLRRHPDAKVVALTMDDAGIPEGAERRVEIAVKLIALLTENGIKPENIFIDCLVQPVSVNQENVLIFLRVIRELKRLHPAVKTTCGLSNVSFGLPLRRLVNRHFLIVAIYEGLASAIIDPTEEGVAESICITETLIGKDAYCINYLQSFRDGALGSTGPSSGK